MTVSDRTVPRACHAEAGFSLLEGLIAAALLLLVLVSVLPLFSQAMLNNLQGNDASYVSNGTIDGFERISSLPYDNFFINPVAGGTPEIVRTEVFALRGDTWVPDITQSPVANDDVQFTRTATIRQYNIVDLHDNGTLDTPLDPDDTSAVIKVIDFSVTGQRTIGAPAFQTALVKTKG